MRALVGSHRPAAGAGPKLPPCRPPLQPPRPQALPAPCPPGTTAVHSPPPPPPPHRVPRPAAAGG